MTKMTPPKMLKKLYLGFFFGSKISQLRLVGTIVNWPIDLIVVDQTNREEDKQLQRQLHHANEDLQQQENKNLENGEIGLE